MEKVTEDVRLLGRSGFGLPPARTTSPATSRLPPVTISGGSSSMYIQSNLQEEVNRYE